MSEESTAADAIRSKNQATVERFFELHGVERLILFAEDAVKKVAFSESDEPTQWVGMAQLRDHFVGNSIGFPDWKYYNVRVYSTQDPNKFFVEADGSGTLILPGDVAPAVYSNHYVDIFVLEHGKIKLYIEHFNPLNTMKALGVPIPKWSLPNFTAPPRE
jgi:phenazine biosynthesis protein